MPPGSTFGKAPTAGTMPAAGYLGSAVDADEQFVALVDEPGARGRMPAGAAFTYHGLGIVHAAMGRPDAAHRAWARARELFAEYDHHALMVFTLLGEMRDVALTYGAAEPATRRRLAAEAEAALGRAGGALRPGVSPRLAWLGCLALDGRWDEALRILDDLPPPGNAHLRREMTDTRAILARHRGEPETAWAQIRPLLPGGARDRARRHHPPGRALPPAPRGRPLPRRGRSCRQRGPGWRRTTAGSPGAGASSAAPTGGSPGRATTGRPATPRAPAPPRPRRWRSPHRHPNRWSAWPPTASWARSRPRPNGLGRPMPT